MVSRTRLRQSTNMFGERPQPSSQPGFRRRLRSGFALSATLLCAAFAVAPGGAGAVGWVTGSPLTPNGRVARDPGIVETASGTRVLAWQQRGTGADDPASINVRVAPPGAGFGATQAIPDDSAAPPSLSVGSDGTVALVWLDFPNNVPTIRIARLAPGATRFVVAAGVAAGGSVGSELQTAVAGGDILVAYSVFGTQGPTTLTAIDAVRLPAGTTTIQPVPGAASPDIERVSFTNTAPSLIDANPTVAALGGTIFVAWELDANGASWRPVKHDRAASRAVHDRISAGRDLHRPRAAGHGHHARAHGRSRSSRSSPLEPVASSLPGERPTQGRSTIAISPLDLARRRTRSRRTPSTASRHHSPATGRSLSDGRRSTPRTTRTPSLRAPFRPDKPRRPRGASRQ